MRVSTALVSALVAGSSFGLAWQYAVSNQEQLPELNTAEPADSSSSAASNSGSTAATGSSESGSTPTKTVAPSSSGSTPSKTPTATPTKPAAPVVISLTSDPITYKYGVVQLKITKTDGQITDVAVLQGDASNGRDAAYATLIDATLQVQGTNYGNISGATFTTDAFKKAVANALAKG